MQLHLELETLASVKPEMHSPATPDYACFRLHLQCHAMQCTDLPVAHVALVPPSFTRDTIRVLKIWIHDPLYIFAY